MQDSFRQHCIIVLGMHRSGTSLLARIVNLLGVEIGNNLVPPRQDNVLGFWEHKEIMEIHEKVFDILGKPWICFLSPLPENWWLHDEIIPLRQKLIEIVHRDFSHTAVWVLKDPRLCRLLPLWHSIFNELNCHSYFIHITRNPLEVAESLKKRDALTLNVSLLLWLEGNQGEAQKFCHTKSSYRKLALSNGKYSI